MDARTENEKGVFYFDTPNNLKKNHFKYMDVFTGFSNENSHETKEKNRY